MNKEFLKKIKIVDNIYRKSIILTTYKFPKIASQIKYLGTFGKFINFKEPTGFNEKLMWLKINEDDKLKTICTDKYKVREYISNKGFNNILNQLYFVYDSSNQINYDILPDKFVLKCNKGSGGNIICRDKSKLDKSLSNSKLDEWMDTDYSLISAEIHVKDIEPKIICEKYLEEESQEVPIDYKIHCFNGIPKVIELVVNRYKEDKAHIYLDCDWNNLNYSKNDLSNNFDVNLYKPKKLKEMLNIANILSEDFTYVRVDLYHIENKVIFGELTFTPAGCCDTDLTDTANIEMGNLLKISNI